MSVYEPPPRGVLAFGRCEVQILSRELMEAWEPPDVPHVVVSITDPGDSRVQIRFGRKTCAHDRVAFHDIPYSFRGLIGPDEVASDLADALETFALFARLRRMPRLVVHCTAGISRSSAVAVAWLKMHKEDPSRLYDLFAPNRWVVTELEKALRERGAL